MIYGDGEQSRDFTYIDNAVDANLLASRAPDVGGEVFNIACGERITLNRLVAELRAVSGTEFDSRLCRGSARRCPALARRDHACTGQTGLRAEHRLPRGATANVRALPRTACLEGGRRRRTVT
jgi:nucleoside-diphosphate-sugar epimerase